MNTRHNSLLKHAGKIDCDTLITFRPENIFYMTGFWGEAAAILQKNSPAIIIAPELEAFRAASDSKNSEIIIAERSISGLAASAAKIAKTIHNNGAGICTDCTDFQTMTYLKQKLSKIKQTQEPFYAARMIKDASEIRILKKASKIIDNLFETCANKLRIGQKESDMQSILMAEASIQGAFDVGYSSTLNPLIIAGGPNGALPHAQVSQRKFKKGDLVVVDLTLRYRGYVSDSTRTFAMGRVSKEARNIYDIVYESQQSGLYAVRAGVSCNAIDAACRSYIESCGYEKYFIHSTGHGIGLEVHELPAVSRKISTKLKKGMAITIEPGIYIPGKFGVRIEDSLLVQKSGPLLLHKFTKKLINV